MTDMTSKVMWRGKLSEPYPVTQGNKQGEYCWPDEYKDYQLPLLLMIYLSEVGFSIGSVKVPCPTVADDMILTASSMHDLQTLLWMHEMHHPP